MTPACGWYVCRRSNFIQPGRNRGWRSMKCWTFTRSNGTKPRYRGNRLIFLAPDQASLARVT